MLDLGTLRRHIQALDKGDAASRRQALLLFKDHDAQAWTTAPVELVPALLESLQRQLRSERKNSFICKEVMIILGNLGARSEPAIPQIIELLQEGNPDGIRDAAAAALGTIGRALSDRGCANERVRTVLSELWVSPSRSRIGCLQLAMALCKLKIEATGLLRFLTSTLVANQDVAHRKSAAEALAWCESNEPDVVPALLTAALTDKVEAVRQKAAASLAQLHLSHEKASYLCATQLKDSCYAETALRNCGQLGVPALIEALETEEPTTREKAARILGGLGEMAAAARPALTRALRDKDLDFRLAAAKGLWMVTKEAEVVVPVLIDLLEERGGGTPEVSEQRRRFLQTVMEALCRIGRPAKAAISALTNKAKHKNRLISESALTALKGITPTLANTAGVR